MTPTTSFTLTRRHDSVVLETGVVGYVKALLSIEKYPNVDVIIHEDGTDWVEKNRKSMADYDITQGGWAWL
jgi:hypothetical protein